MRGRKLCRRRYFIPTNRRTAARSRARGAFGAIAKAWSRVLTEQQRRAWNAAAAKVRSRPRLWQSGWLSGQAFFQGICSAQSRIGREMLLWPPTGPVVFGPNPVEGLNISEEQGRLRLRLRVVGPVDGDIMVFGATPCSAGRKKWWNGAFLGLLPAPVGGESDITELYVARYGEPEPGKRVFIRTRQQREGWEDHSRNVHEVVLAKAGAAGVEIRGPKPAEAVTSVSCGAALKGGSVRGRRGQVPSPHNSFVRREGAGYLVLSDRCMSCLLCRAR